MSVKEYLILMGNGVRKRHMHETRMGKVVAFMVQWEIQHQGIWTTVIRYDSAHGFTHIDRYNIKRHV